MSLRHTRPASRRALRSAAVTVSSAIRAWSSARKDAKRQSAADAARELVDATARRQRDRVLTFPARAAVALQRLSPSLADVVVRRVMRHRL